MSAPLCLCIHPPFADLIVYGHKTFELRGWAREERAATLVAFSPV